MDAHRSNIIANNLRRFQFMDVKDIITSVIRIFSPLYYILGQNVYQTVRLVKYLIIISIFADTRVKTIQVNLKFKRRQGQFTVHGSTPSCRVTGLKEHDDLSSLGDKKT